MDQVKQECFDANDGEDIRSFEGSEWTLETTSIGVGTIGDENSLGNESSSINALLEVP
jgi:hypothetical protein